MARIVTFGELMLRLAPNGYYRFFQNDQMQVLLAAARQTLQFPLQTMEWTVFT